VPVPLLPELRAQLVDALAPGALVHGVVLSGGRPDAPSIRLLAAHPLRASPPHPPSSRSVAGQPTPHTRPALQPAYRVCETALPAVEAAELVSVCARRSDGRRYRPGDLVCAQVLRTEAEPRTRLVLGPARRTEYTRLARERDELERAVAGAYHRDHAHWLANANANADEHADADARRHMLTHTDTRTHAHQPVRTHAQALSSSPPPSSPSRVPEARDTAAYNAQLRRSGTARNPRLAEVLRRSFGLQEHGTLLGGGHRGLHRLDQPVLHYGVLRRRQYRRWADDAVRRGVVLAKRGRVEAALKLYKEALGTCPDHADALVARGAAYANLGRLVHAVNEFRAALRVEPQHANALRYLSTCRDRLAAESGTGSNPNSAVCTTTTTTTTTYTQSGSSSSSSSTSAPWPQLASLRATTPTSANSSAVATGKLPLAERLRQILSEKEERKRKRERREHSGGSGSRSRRNKQSGKHTTSKTETTSKKDKRHHKKDTENKKHKKKKKKKRRRRDE
jgi:tetratricopeptide (TPR) repeat protein